MVNWVPIYGYCYRKTNIENIQGSSIKTLLCPLRDTNINGWTRRQLENARFSERWKNDIDECSSNLLEIASCGLHVLHGAFKIAQSPTTLQ